MKIKIHFNEFPRDQIVSREPKITEVCDFYVIFYFKKHFKSPHPKICVREIANFNRRREEEQFFLD